MPDTELLMNFVFPAATAALCCGSLAWLIEWRWRRAVVAAIFVQAGLVIGLLVGLFLKEGLAFPPERDWHAIFIGGALLAVIAPWFVRVPPHVPLIPVLSGAAVYLVLEFAYPAPTAEAAGGPAELENLQLSHLRWIVAAVFAAALNAMLLHWVSYWQGQRWFLWIAAAHILAITGAIMTCYGTLATDLLGIASMVVILAALRSISSVGDWVISLLLPMSAMFAVSPLMLKVYDYSEPPAWIYAPLLFLPAMVCAIDLAFLRTKSPKLRISAAAVLSVALAAAPIVYLMTQQPDY